MSLHYERPARRPDHPNSGRCALSDTPEELCVSPPAFEVDCDECGCYFELCADHAMVLASGQVIYVHGECESESATITVMQVE